MKKWIILAVSILAVIFILSLAKDMIIKVSVEKGVNLVTGLRLKMGSLKVGLLGTLVQIKDLELLNPAGYKDRTMLDMPEVFVDYALMPLLKGKIYLTEVRIDLKKLVVVKNENGELNLDALKVVQAEKETKGKRPSVKKELNAPPMRIDSLTLKIGSVIYKDYSKGGAPAIREFNINLNEKYSDIDDLNIVVSLIVIKALSNTTVPSLANFDLQGLKGNTGDVLGTAQKLTGEAAAKVQAVTRRATRVVDETGSVTRQATDTVQKTTETLQDILKNPFGSGEK
ncbi:MAG: AsmA family protein [Candidatus Omnitrophica bacterium]|nr:AsmA family protein [Candidatus Omnitrophota bacterium]